ncbi:MAG TPA: hypothetical protein VLF43_05490 [Candidatus Saccharimonadales bacterium]|nr:hypothetical protein [Candidatus Saccharimonadales bacterium]
MKYFLGFLVALGLIILVVILIIRALGGGGGNETVAPKAVLSDYANTATVTRLSIDSRVNGEEDHFTVRITVGRDERTIETVSGYDGDVTATKTLDNDQEAYTVFLRALQFQGYTNGDTDKAKADERGLCPTSKRYIYEIISPGGSSIQRF